MALLMATKVDLVSADYLQLRPDGCQAEDQNSSCWAEAPIKIARMTLTIKLDGNWSSFQLANSAPPLSVTDSAIAPSARMVEDIRAESSALTLKVAW